MQLIIIINSRFIISPLFYWKMLGVQFSEQRWPSDGLRTTFGPHHFM